LVDKGTKSYLPSRDIIVREGRPDPNGRPAWSKSLPLSDTFAVGVRPAIFVWLVYAFIDVAVLAASGPTLKIGALGAVSFLTKLASAYLGALVAGWRA
jgi:hypothetical protein